MPLKVNIILIQQSQQVSKFPTRNKYLPQHIQKMRQNIIILALIQKLQLINHFYKLFEIMKQPYNFSKRLTDDTDIQDSQTVPKPQMRKYKRKRVPKYQRELKRLTKIANYIKILRFRSSKLNKTLRVYCYDENTLGWPHRFVKKINKMVSDNDRDSDEQLIQDDKNRCLKSLFEALQERKKTERMEFSQT